jgi:hypothetical protein
MKTNPTIPKCVAWRLVFPVFLATCLLGCGEASMPPPRVGVENWKPTPVGGPLELRPLPPANQVLENYRDWMKERSGDLARVYEVTLDGVTNQRNFTVEVLRGETPLGRPEHTDVSFIYTNSTIGAYKFQWHRLGRHNADFLKLHGQSKQVWVELNWRASKPELPIVQIVAFEGLEPDGVLLAEPGGELK